MPENKWRIWDVEVLVVVVVASIFVTEFVYLLSWIQRFLPEPIKFENKIKKTDTCHIKTITNKISLTADAFFPLNFIRVSAVGKKDQPD